MVALESQAVFLKRFFEFNFNSLQKIHGTKIHGTKIHGTIKEWNTCSKDGTQAQRSTIYVWKRTSQNLNQIKILLLTESVTCFSFGHNSVNAFVMSENSFISLTLNDLNSDLIILSGISYTVFDIRYINKYSIVYQKDLN